jgi:hypothetical protein
MDNGVAIGAVAVATPVLSFAGSWFGGWLNRRTARELDRWRRREETMRLLRWASELAADQDAAKAAVGWAALQALTTSEMLQAADFEMVVAVTDAVLAKEIVRYRADQNLRERPDVDVGLEVGGNEIQGDA